MNRSIYQHIKDHGSYIVGECALGALKAARLVTLALECGLRVQWGEDQWPDLSWADEHTLSKIERGALECLEAYVTDDDGNALAALGGIVLDPNDEDARLAYEYELLAEAMHTILKGEEE